MSDLKIEGYEFKPGFKGMAKDTGSDQTMFKGVHWGKAMMWIFLLSDTFIFSCFLISSAMLFPIVQPGVVRDMVISTSYFLFILSDILIS